MLAGEAAEPFPELVEPAEVEAEEMQGDAVDTYVPTGDVGTPGIMDG
jgi:hypothetical protein